MGYSFHEQLIPHFVYQLQVQSESIGIRRRGLISCNCCYNGDLHRKKLALIVQYWYIITIFDNVLILSKCSVSIVFTWTFEKVEYFFLGEKCYLYYITGHNHTLVKIQLSWRCNPTSIYSAKNGWQLMMIVFLLRYVQWTVLLFCCSLPLANIIFCSYLNSYIGFWIENIS